MINLKHHKDDVRQMSRILHKLKHEAKPSITDDQYRESVANNATIILSSLFKSAPINLKDLQTINILVIGAGFFPSFLPLVKVISSIAPNMTELQFTLIEPLKSETERFHDYFSTLSKTGEERLPNIRYSAHNTGIKEFLQSNQNVAFDIIYFEQPDLSPIGILLAKKGREDAKLVASLRAAIPYLKKVIKPDAIIVASCLFKTDLIQLNSLINFSLNIKTRLEYIPRTFSDGVPYSSGLISVVDPKKLTKINPDKIAATINKYDATYCLIMFVSIIIFMLTPSWAKILSSFFTIALVIYHRYGVGALMIKLALIATQLGVLAGSIMVNDSFTHSNHKAIIYKDTEPGRSSI